MELRHLLGLPVALGAGVRDVGPRHGRGGMSGVEERVGVAVAIPARGCLGNSAVQGNPVVALQIDFGFDVVTLAAANRFQGYSVRNFRHIGVAARASIAAMD
ncbi:MAG: hypothetical protein HYU33_07530 [Candidatus Omnitrophica bacterium]|nr:hypothetical protein [Candidatus Omnitrophota bacterium]